MEIGPSWGKDWTKMWPACDGDRAERTRHRVVVGTETRLSFEPGMCRDGAEQGPHPGHCERRQPKCD
jgi:hypothetical protein